MTGVGETEPQSLSRAGMDKMPENPDSILRLSTTLADMIEAHCVATGEQFDKLMVVPRGGYAPANTISRRLGFDATSILHAGITHYRDGETTGEEVFQYGQMPTPEECKGLNLLVLDEVCDTGATLNHLYDLLRLAGAGLIRTAVLHYKPNQSTTGFVPDWHIIRTDAWIDYPWEADETHGQLSVVRRRPQVNAV